LYSFISTSSGFRVHIGLWLLRISQSQTVLSTFLVFGFSSLTSSTAASSSSNFSSLSTGSSSSIGSSTVSVLLDHK